MRAIFFGFSPSTGSNEKLHDIIKSTLPTAKPFVAVCERILRLSEELLSKCEQIKIEKTPI